MKTKTAIIIGILTLVMCIPTASALPHMPFVEYPSNPIYGATLGNGTAYYPCVLKDNNDFSGYGASSLYKMWYYTGGGTKLVYSADGIHWSSPAINMVNVTNCYHATVIYEENGFGNGYHYRIDWCTNPGGTIDISVMKYAWSNDGINWEGTTSLTQSVTNVSMRLCNDSSGYFWQTCGASQIFYNPTATNPGWGTIDDISDDGSPWEYTWTLVYEPTRNQEHTGLAYSADGTYFIRYGGDYPILIANGTGWDASYSYGLCIVHNANIWVGLYTGGVDSQYHQGIGFAYSLDGLHWVKGATNPVMHINDSIPWRSARTYTPFILREGDVYEMWYTGQNGADQKNIGYATFLNLPPNISSQSPANNSKVKRSFQFGITINDPNGDYIFWTIEANNGQKTNGISLNGTHTINLTGVKKNIKIWVNASDGIDTVKAYYTYNYKELAKTNDSTTTNITTNVTTPVHLTGYTNQNYGIATILLGIVLFVLGCIFIVGKQRRR